MRMILAEERRIAYQHGVHDGGIDTGYHDIEWETCANASCIEARES